MSTIRSNNDYGRLIARFIEEQYEQERMADPEIFPLDKFEWLSDAIVTKNIIKENNQWIVYLVFVHPLDPKVFYRAPVKCCQTRRLAEIVASYHRHIRLVDPALDFSVNIDDLNCCWN